MKLKPELGHQYFLIKKITYHTKILQIVKLCSGY